MTKEEYERLLQSDYWKGYSYSLIKERNFTCEDCGSYFPNERNMLQVHHLVYRDINPWSYKPEELVVLCRACHQRRHGIIPEEEPVLEEEQETEIPHISSENVRSSIAEREFDRFDGFVESGNKLDKRPVWLFFAFAAFLLIVGLYDQSTKERERNKAEQETFESVVVGVPQAESQSKTTSRKSGKLKKKQKDETEAFSTSTEYVAETPELVEEQVQPDKVVAEEVDLSKLSTSEINDRIYRKQVEERARREGVSTEGTTSEINDRIYRKQVEERARREGVSTEGTTSEINDRIYRKQVEERARREGVSTEGTTSEINDRIYRKQVEERARREGVSTEGTTSEINDRIYRKQVEERAKKEGIK